MIGSSALSGTLFSTKMRSQSKRKLFLLYTTLAFLVMDSFLARL
jgi:hypothetical protein